MFSVERIVEVCMCIKTDIKVACAMTDSFGWVVDLAIYSLPGNQSFLCKFNVLALSKCHSGQSDNNQPSLDKTH